MKRYYFDYAATTPVSLKVLKEMLPYFRLNFGNPSSLHYFGQKALKAIDESRQAITSFFGTDFDGVIFTGSATEANNLVLRGVLKNFLTKEKSFRPKIITSLIEHDSVLNTLKDLTDFIDLIFLEVDKNGFVNLKKLENLIDEKTVLVSLIYANNEIGVIQPLKKISNLLNDFKKQKNLCWPFFHTDAVQAVQYLNCDLNELGVDFMTVSAHKIYGPKGIGALLINKNLLKNLKSFLKPIITGGYQEFGWRAGTENVPLIVGFKKALEIVLKDKAKNYQKIKELRDYFFVNLKKIYPSVLINPRLLNTRFYDLKTTKFFLPNILNLYFPDYLAADLLIKLDLAGICVSAGSACSLRSLEPSHVLLALKIPLEQVKRSLRFSFGRGNNLEQIKAALKILKKVL